MPVIQFQNVSFAYSPGAPVLEGVNFEVRDGEFLGLIGPNGGGKTTMLKLMLGMLRPQGGEVRVLSRAAHTLGRDRRLVGYVPQDVAISRQFPATVFDVALMGTYATLGLFKRPGKPSTLPLSKRSIMSV